MSNGLPGFRSGEQRALFRAAVAAGWTWRVSGDTHVIIRSPDGEHYVSLSTTANDKGRQALNARAKAKRAGLIIARGGRKHRKGDRG